MPRRYRKYYKKALPKHVIYVGRPSKWGNPIRVSKSVPQALAVRKYYEYLNRHPELKEQAKMELRGRDLACWCKLGTPCHAEVLLEIANAS